LLIRKGERRKMKYKYLLGILFTMMLLTSMGSALAFWHPPPDDKKPPCPTFVVVIEDEGMLTSTYRFNFTEPDYGFCSDVTVEVWILNVEDMFAYEFKLYWDEIYFKLTAWTVEDVWPSQFPVKPEATYDGSEPYHQAVSALAPSTGVTGDFKLATLTFHIINDVCWRQQEVLGRFKLDGLKASNSCSDPIPLCDPFHGWWKFIAVQPEIYIDPEDEVNCVVGETFVSTIWIKNIVKMKSIHFVLVWYGNVVGVYEPTVYRPIKCTTEDDIEINDDVFPEDDIDTYTISLWAAADNSSFSLTIDLVMDCDFPLINGTFWAFKITWLKQDPWECGRQPVYTKHNHEWDTTNATTPQKFWDGYFDVMCPDLKNIWFGDTYGDLTGVDWGAIQKGAKYTFDPVPGDLNGDGEVDVTDLAIIASFYGKTHPYTYPEWYYDFVDPFHIIDIFDVTVVAKNFGRSCPY